MNIKRIFFIVIALLVIIPLNARAASISVGTCVESKSNIAKYKCPLQINGEINVNTFTVRIMYVDSDLDFFNSTNEKIYYSYLGANGYYIATYEFENKPSDVIDYIYTNRQNADEFESPVWIASLSQNPFCAYYKGKYYGTAGTEVATLQEFVSDCLSSVSCEYIESNSLGKLFVGKTRGTLVDFETYAKECKNACSMQINPIDNTKVYIDEDKNITNLDGYLKCSYKSTDDKTKCAYVYGKYSYNGDIVTASKFKENCISGKIDACSSLNYVNTNPIFKNLSDNDTKLYFDKDKKLVTKSEYTESCEKKEDPVIPPENDPDDIDPNKGKPNNTDPTEDPVTPPTNDPTDQDPDNDKSICRIKDGKYYIDYKNNKEVSKEEYERLCVNNYCKVENNNYYLAGQKVSKAEFQKECGPITGNQFPIVMISAGVLFVVTAGVIVKKKTKLFNI